MNGDGNHTIQLCKLPRKEEEEEEEEEART